MIDLIAVEYPDRREMSLAIIGGPCEDKMLGPVPYRDAVSALAPMLIEILPEFTLDEATKYLMVLHFRNITRGSNSSGMTYPYKTEKQR